MIFEIFVGHIECGSRLLRNPKSKISFWSATLSLCAGPQQILPVTLKTAKQKFVFHTFKGCTRNKICSWVFCPLWGPKIKCKNCYPNFLFWQLFFEVKGRYLQIWKKRFIVDQCTLARGKTFRFFGNELIKCSQSTAMCQF